MAPAVLGLAAVQINVFVNTQFASSLGDGPVAQLTYAFRVFFLPIGVFSVALATVTTTSAAERAAADDLPGLRAATLEAVGGVWMLLGASVVVMFALSSPVVSLLFERGAFGPEDTAATARVMQAYAIGLLPYGMVKVVAPVLYSLDRARSAGRIHHGRHRKSCLQRAHVPRTRRPGARPRDVPRCLRQHRGCCACSSIMRWGRSVPWGRAFDSSRRWPWRAR